MVHLQSYSTGDFGKVTPKVVDTAGRRKTLAGGKEWVVTRGVAKERVLVSGYPQFPTEVKSLALEKLEEIAQQVVDFLSKYNLTYDEMFYVLGYVERSLNMDMVEEMLEDFGLINSEEEEEES